MAGNVEDESLKISQGPGMYRISTPVNSSTSVNIPTFGLPLDRMQREPPANFVDSESLLAGRYDILGKYGLAERHTEYGSNLLRQARKAHPPPTIGKPLVHDSDFFKPASGRMPQMPCNDIMSKSFFRPDSNYPESIPPVSYRPTNNTRQLAKDLFAKECAM